MKKFFVLFLLIAAVFSATAYPGPYATENFSHDFLLEDIVEYNVNEADGTVSMLVKSEADQVAFYVQFYVENGVLTTGVYTIDDSKQAGTVQKGSQGSDFIKPTFCAQMTDDGYFLIPAWLCEEGTVTVSFDANSQPVIAMNAKTAQGYEIEVSVNAQSAGNELSLDGLYNPENIADQTNDVWGRPLPHDACGLVIQNNRIVLRR